MTEGVMAITTKEYNELKAEIERLTRERDEVSLLAVNRLIEIDRVRARYDSATDQAVRYADDNERLTAALTKIRSVVGTSTEAWLIANRALEQKP
jgi:uncharacterized pyridoxal phosphate-containing UPF0001 family protein